MKKQSEEILKGVSDFYAKAISGDKAEARSCCGEGKSKRQGFAQHAGYTDDELESVPSEAAGSSFGCGNPLAFSKVREGDNVLDLGSGAGIDCFIAANKVGKTGKVIGLDMTREMIDKARKAAKEGGYANVEFVLGQNEEMPLDDSTVDWVISNCVINLSPEKDRVFSEAFRVLKPGGRLLVSDIVAEGITDSMRQDISAWASCVSGAASEDEYLSIISQSGFDGVEVVDRVDYKAPAGPGPSKISSIRVSAVKPNGTRERSRGMKDISNVLDTETQLLIATGSAVAAGCIPCLQSIVEKARAAGVDEKKLRMAAMTGQFVKDQPASHMKALSDELLSTHLQTPEEASGGGCPMEAGKEAPSESDTSKVAGSADKGGCGCSS
jgi:arsenite methyltransferase